MILGCHRIYSIHHACNVFFVHYHCLNYICISMHQPTGTIGEDIECSKQQSDDPTIGGFQDQDSRAFFLTVSLVFVLNYVVYIVDQQLFHVQCSSGCNLIIFEKF